MISQYEKLTKEYNELSKVHAALQEKKYLWGWGFEENAKGRIVDDMCASTVAIPLANGDARLGGDRGILDDEMIMLLFK